MRRHFLLLSLGVSSSSAFTFSAVSKWGSTSRIVGQQSAIHTPIVVDTCAKRKVSAASLCVGRSKILLRSSESSNGDSSKPFDNEFLEFGQPPMPLGGEAVYEGYGGEHPNQDAVSNACRCRCGGSSESSCLEFILHVLQMTVSCHPCIYRRWSTLQMTSC